MNGKELLENLRNEPEIICDEHDGSYEIMRAVVDAYGTVSDFNQISYTDLDLIYLMAIGTWTDGIELKKNRVRNSILAEDVKEKLIQIIEFVWDKAGRKEYKNTNIPDKFLNSDNEYCIGMFGTGFKSFSRYQSDEWNLQIRGFIRMLVEIRDMNDDNEIFDCAEKILSHPIKGIQAAAASVIFHCLKPYTFPILNGNEGNGNCYELLGISLKNCSSAENYIDNCRKIKAFRDANLPFKNYRIIDLWTARATKPTEEELWPSLKEYPTVLSKEQWLEFLEKDRKEYPKTLEMLMNIYKMGGEATCKALSQEYGESSSAYISRGTNLGKRAKKAYDLPPCMDGDVERYFAIPFQGHQVKEDMKTNELYAWVLRKELKEALEKMGIEEKDYSMNTEFDHNIILYGPPGTGKTYNSARYAVAICDELSLKEVNSWKYEDVLKRYNELKEANRIAFTTFHQSYGYEEFIEGIRPNVDEDNAEGLTYRREDGIFKKFCDEAGRPMIKNVGADFGFNNNPVVWKVSLKGTGDNEVRTECLENGHIRIGWDEYGENITDDIEYTSGGKVVLDSFYNKMRIGDIVVSCYSSETTDAIGVITGEPEWSEQYDYYRRIRKVKWLIKGKNENITSYNNNKAMTLSSVYKLSMSVRNVIDIISKYTTNLVEEENNKKYVFIIDEINRGNISKIFGELITLIEETKRVGSDEEMKAILPYSKTAFGVPNNVYILGTMNTADRSIALMDTALRRRFSFIEMMPEPDVLDGITVSDKGETVNIAELLNVINKRIECLFDREHTIGHAFFTKLRNDPSIQNLSMIFKKSVVPLLQEYFYEDYDKIRLVLGDNGKKDSSIEFVTKTEFDVSIFRTSRSDDMPDEKADYQINYTAYDNIWSYKGISERL